MSNAVDVVEERNGGHGDGGEGTTSRSPDYDRPNSIFRHPQRAGDFNHRRTAAGRRTTWRQSVIGKNQVMRNQVLLSPNFHPRVVARAFHDAGVFVSQDSGDIWMNMTGNLPNAMVVDLVLQEKDSTLSAAT